MRALEMSGDSGQACITVHCCQHALVVDSALLLGLLGAWDHVE